MLLSGTHSPRLSCNLYTLNSFILYSCIYEYILNAKHITFLIKTTEQIPALNEVKSIKGKMVIAVMPQYHTMCYMKYD